MFSARSFRPWAQNLRNLTVRAKKTTGRFYFRPGKIASLVSEMIRSPEMDEAEAVRRQGSLRVPVPTRVGAMGKLAKMASGLVPGVCDVSAKGSSATSAGLIAPGSPGRCRSCSAAVSGM
jgi:hypothetical protein